MTADITSPAERADREWLSAQGSPFDIGLALGRRGRRAVHQALVPSEAWQRLAGSGHASRAKHLFATTRERFPWIVEELRGLAQGLDLPLHDVFAWNCRGDLLTASPDGCTTVALPGPAPCIAHNEDGLPTLDGETFLLSARPDGQPAFLAFCYPGSIPGHTFALTQAGIVQTVNNLRLAASEPDIPRMVLCRAMLTRPSLDAILALLAQAPASGGFNFTLAQRGDPRLLGVELGAGRLSCRAIETPALHANHALHHDFRHDRQRITRSSRDRQRRGEALLAAGERNPLAILRDTGGDGLPIFRRDPEDPDDENTLASAIFDLREDDIHWAVHRPGESQPRRGTLCSLFG